MNKAFSLLSAGIRQCEGVAIKQCWLAQVNFDALDRNTIKVHDGTKMTKQNFDLGGKAVAVLVFSHGWQSFFLLSLFGKVLTAFFFLFLLFFLAEA